jgi:hypothetical protein
VTKVTRLAQQKCCRDLLFRNHERLFATQKDQRIVGASVLVAHKVGRMRLDLSPSQRSQCQLQHRFP